MALGFDLSDIHRQVGEFDYGTCEIRRCGLLPRWPVRRPPGNLPGAADAQRREMSNLPSVADLRRHWMTSWPTIITGISRAGCDFM